jgi:hypothetical protein
VASLAEEGVVPIAVDEKAIEELGRHHTDRVGPGSSPRSPRKTPSAFVVLWWIAVFTVIFGAVRPGLGMGFAVALGWLLWRFLPTLGDLLEDASEVDDYRDPR